MTGLEKRRPGRPRTCDCGTCSKCKGREYSRRYRETSEGQAKMLAGRRSEHGRAVKAAYDRSDAAVKARAVYVKTPHGREMVARMRSKPTNLVKIAARRAVADACLSGRLVRGDCAVGHECDGQIHAHHWSYEREDWLDVTWLCQKHHLEEHAK